MEWISDTLEKVSFWSGTLSVLAGVISYLLADLFSFNPVAPFLASIPLMSKILQNFHEILIFFSFGSLHELVKLDGEQKSQSQRQILEIVREWNSRNRQ